MTVAQPILKVRSGAFEPHAVQVMSRAFDEVCLALTLNDEDAHARDVVAVRIIELARRGELNARRLRDRVLRESGAALPAEPAEDAGWWRELR